MDYSSNSKGNLGVTLGAIGTGLSVLNNGNGLLGGILGGNQNANYVTKDMLALQMQLVDTQKDLAIKTADLDSEKKMVDVYNNAVNRTNAVRDELSARIREVEAKVDNNAAAQSVINCQFSSNLTLANSQIAQLFGLTKMVIPAGNVCGNTSGTTTA